MLKNFFRTHVISIDEVSKQLFELSSDNIDILEAVRSLPPKYKNVVYLHYYEGYTAPEIANKLHKNVNTIYTYLTRSKKVLYEKLGGDGYE